MSDFDPRLVKRLRTGAEPSDALDELVQNGQAAHPEVISAVEELTREGRPYILEKVLVRWLIAAAPASTSVFNARWQSLRGSREAVLALYRAEAIAPRQVEEQVLSMLDDFGTLPEEPYRPLFFDAVRVHGSARCVPWLKSLLLDLKAEAAVQRDVARASQDTLHTVMAAALNESVQKCADAIAAIEIRRLTSGQPSGERHVASSLNARPSRFVKTHLENARLDAASTRPGACLNTLRLFAEALCDDLYVRWSVGNSPPDNLSPKLNAMKDALKTKNRWLQARLWALKHLVDFGSHHTEEFVDHLTAGEVQPVLDLAEGIHRTYLSLE